MGWLDRWIQKSKAELNELARVRMDIDREREEIQRGISLRHAEARAAGGIAGRLQYIRDEQGNVTSIVVERRFPASWDNELYGKPKEAGTYPPILYIRK